MAESTSTGPYATAIRWWLYQNARVGTSPILTGINPAADAWQVGRHIAFHAKAGRAYSTVKTYLAGIGHMHVIRGLPNPTAYPFVRKAMKAYRRAFGKAGKPKKALTSWLLRKIAACAGPRNDRQSVIWAAILVAFNCALRGSEYAFKGGKDKRWDPADGLTRGNVTWVFGNGPGHLPTAMSLTIVTSKTDPWRFGNTFQIQRTGGPLCAVTAVWNINRQTPGAPSTAPLFSINGGPLRFRVVTAEIKRLVSKVHGLDPKDFSTHSLRSGAATSLRAAGVDWDTIKILGRWRSDCSHLYSQIHPSELFNIATLMQDAPDASAGATVSFSNL